MADLITAVRALAELADYETNDDMYRGWREPQGLVVGRLPGASGVIDETETGLLLFWIGKAGGTVMFEGVGHVEVHPEWLGKDYKYVVGVGETPALALTQAVKKL